MQKSENNSGFCGINIFYRFYIGALRSHRLGHRLVSLIYCRETRVPRGALQVDPQRQSGLVWDFSFSYPRSFLPYFMQLSYYSGVYFFFLFHTCCSHARGILCGIHTSFMGSSFLIGHAKWSLIFWSFQIMRNRRVRTDSN